MRSRLERLGLLAALWLPLATHADTVSTKPTGPITITAKTGEWQNDVMLYTGDVVVTSRTLELRGARMELRQPGGSRNPYEITLTGSPATMKHLGETAQDPPVSGRAARLVYRSATQDVELNGDAHIERGKDELNGAVVHYDVAARRVQASGGEQGQVRIVLDVPEAQEQRNAASGKNKPPSAPAGDTP